VSLRRSQHPQGSAYKPHAEGTGGAIAPDTNGRTIERIRCIGLSSTHSSSPCRQPAEGLTLGRRPLRPTSDDDRWQMPAGRSPTQRHFIASQVERPAPPARARGLPGPPHNCSLPTVSPPPRPRLRMRRSLWRKLVYFVLRRIGLAAFSPADQCFLPHLLDWPRAPLGPSARPLDPRPCASPGARPGHTAGRKGGWTLRAELAR